MEQLSIDMEMIIISYGVFLLAYASHTVFRIYQNVQFFHERFAWKRLMNGMIKCIVFVLGTLLLVLAIDSALMVFQSIGFADEVFQDMVSVIMMVSTIGLATLKYIKEAYQTFVSVLSMEGSNK